MRKSFLFILVPLIFAGICFADEKTELTWKAKALLAELELRQYQVQHINEQIIDLAKLLESKGLIFDTQTKTVVEKPKPKAPDKKEDSKAK